MARLTGSINCELLSSDTLLVASRNGKEVHLSRVQHGWGFMEACRASGAREPLNYRDAAR